MLITTIAVILALAAIVALIEVGVCYALKRSIKPEIKPKPNHDV